MDCNSTDCPQFSQKLAVSLFSWLHLLHVFVWAISGSLTAFLFTIEVGDVIPPEKTKDIASAIDMSVSYTSLNGTIDTKPEVGSFTQDEPQQEDQEVEEEQI